MTEWTRCTASNCPLMASMQINGQMTCGHHYQVFDDEQQMQISERIRNDKIRKTYVKVSRSPNSRWAIHWLPMLLNAKTPELRPVEISDGIYETQSVYLSRLYKAMDMSILGQLEIQT